MSALAPRPALGEPKASPGPRVRDPRLAPDPTVPAAIGRGAAFLALALFGGLHWMALLDPGEPGRAFTALLVAGAAGGGLLAAARLPGRARRLACAVVAVAALALALLAGGVSADLLRPAGWSELVDGIVRGIQALPGVRVPYKGVEPWIRIVIPIGGTVLMAVAALLAFWPRRGRLGYPGLALLALVVLYVVPAIALIFTIEFLRGAVLAILVVAFLRVDKLRVRDAKLAGAVAAGVAVGGLIVAPALDSGSPWWDYESWALEASSAKSTSFSWDHSYGPLNWPRDGRELLRVKAERPAYWKAENLDGFDGLHWRHVELRRDPLDDGMPDNLRSIRTWTQTISVTFRNLRSDQVIAGGYASDVEAPTIPIRQQDDGTFLAERTLRRGDAYRATIYSPQPSERLRRAARVTDGIPLDPYLRLNLHTAGTIEQLGLGGDLTSIEFPRWGTTGGVPLANFNGQRADDAAVARYALDQGPYSGVWRLAQRLQRGARTQEDFVENILSYLRTGFSYSELPPAASRTLPGFLLQSKSGYCQQFSGSMALLLRMGGVPARVATGFTSGALDAKTKEYVVRDLDAHSWVEVWYPDYGWVTFDPTPASAPPRAQPDEAGGGVAGVRPVGAPRFPGDAPSGRASGPAAADPGTPWWQYTLLGLAGAALLAAGVWRWRRRGRPRPALDELERALRRTGRDPGHGTTLSALEASFAGTPAAAGYVRALRDARYGGRQAKPTASQRRALRAELGRGGGVRRRLAAWLAMPPHRHSPP